MSRFWEVIRETKHWMDRYEKAAPRAGDPAPDFELCDVDGQNPIRLSQFRGDKPVALVFGSFT